jgi:hypothetical protein
MNPSAFNNTLLLFFTIGSVSKNEITAAGINVDVFKLLRNKEAYTNIAGQSGEWKERISLAFQSSVMHLAEQPNRRTIYSG